MESTGRYRVYVDGEKEISVLLKNLTKLKDVQQQAPQEEEESTVQQQATQEEEESSALHEEAPRSLNLPACKKFMRLACIQEISRTGDQHAPPGQLSQATAPSRAENFPGLHSSHIL